MLGIISGHGAGCGIEFNKSLYHKILQKYGEEYTDDKYPTTLTLTSGIELISNDGVTIKTDKIEGELKIIQQMLPKNKITHITLLCNSLNSNNQYRNFLESNYNYFNICETYRKNAETLILCSNITASKKLYGDNNKYTYKNCDTIIFDCLLRRHKNKNTTHILNTYKNYENILLGCTELSYLYGDLKNMRGGVHDSIDLLTTKIAGEII